MSFTVHELKPTDLAAMREALALYGREFGDAEAYESAPPSDDYLRKRLGDETFVQLAARAGGKVVGALSAYVLRKFEQERAEVYIYDLAVDADHRRQGIATALIERLRSLGQRWGARVIFVQADYGDYAAIRLYESLGTREEVLHFDIPVP